MTKTKIMTNPQHDRTAGILTYDYVDAREVYDLIAQNSKLERDWVDYYVAGYVCDVIGIKHADQTGEFFMAELPCFRGRGQLYNAVPQREFNQFKRILNEIDAGKPPASGMLVIDPKYMK